ETCREEVDQVTVYSWQQSRGHLHNRDLGAQSSVYRAHLQANIAPTNHQQRPRNIRHGERAGGIEETWRIERQVGESGWARPSGHNGMREREALFLPLRRLDTQRGRIHKGSTALHKSDPTAFTQVAQATREFPDDPFFPGP